MFCCALFTFKPKLRFVFHPRHIAAQFLADFLDLVILIGFQFRVEIVATAFVFGHPFVRELTALNFGQNFLHFVFGGGRDDAAPDVHVAPFGGVGNRGAHSGDAFLIHQIHDEFHLVQALEIGHFGRVTGLDQSLESGANQFAGAAAQNRLFAEQVGFGLFFERGS